MQTLETLFASLNAAEHWRLESSAASPWIRVVPKNDVTPPQGWKLHVSAASFSALEVLSRALPVLLQEKACFKVAASTHILDALNSGSGGLSQIGKFLTVYPADDAQAVRLAVALDNATRGLRGPTILTDGALNAQSLVHYRYGDFSSQRLQTPTGESVPAITAPNGELVPDPRATFYVQPPWVNDPFIAAGIATQPSPQNALIGNRYLKTGQLFQSPSGTIWMAVDTHSGERCILKMARRDAALKPDGRDARDRLRNEYKALTCLQQNGEDKRFPRALDLLEENGDLFLVQEDVEGERLDKHLLELRTQGRLLSSTRIADWGAQIAAMLQTIHDKGWIYRDLKPSNVFIAPDGTLRLIDFDIAHEISYPLAPMGKGTRGYISPQAAQGEVSISDDIYSLGALLFFAVTNAEPSESAQPFDLLKRPLRLLNPHLDERLEQIIAHCLGSQKAERFSSATDVESSLKAIEYSKTRSVVSIVKNANDIVQRCREYARRLGDSICEEAQISPDGHGLWWPNALDATQPPSRDLAMGNSGTLLALAEIVAELKTKKHRETLMMGAQTLANAPRPASRKMAGLYIGEAGVGAALLRAGQILKNDDLIEAATEQSRWVAAQPHSSPDLFNGTAGRLRFHLFLWDATGEREHLQFAIEAGETLLNTAQHVATDELCWPEHTPQSAKKVLGYAHGAAGIADSLLDLFEVTHDERFADAARQTANWLSRQAVRVLDDGSGLAWPFAQGSIVATPFWCHGACGIGRFFLHAATLNVFDGALEIASKAARSVALGSRWSGPTQCHGLAGNIEFLLDMFRATDEKSYLDDAHWLFQLLEAFAVERNGQLVWSGHLSTKFAPIYMTGYAGIAACLLRLSDPQQLPHALSRDNFRRRDLVSSSSRTKSLVAN